MVDLFNQSQQFDLKLEKHWVTEDRYFQLVASLFGIIVTDCWKSYLWHLAPQHQGIKIAEYRRLLARDFLENEFSSRRTLQDYALTIMDSQSSVPPVASTTTRSETHALTTPFPSQSTIELAKRFHHQTCIPLSCVQMRWAMRFGASVECCSPDDTSANK